MKKSSPKHEGFTLLEVIISFAFISIISIGIYSHFMTSLKTNKSGEIKQQAVSYGQKIFEDFRSGDIQKTLTKDVSGNYTLTLSNGIQLQGDESSYKKADYDLKNGYKADIEVIRNDSQIGSEQTLLKTKSAYNYVVGFKKTDLKTASIKDMTNNGDWNDVTVDSAVATEIEVEVDDVSDGKTISVKVGGQVVKHKFNYNDSQDDKNKDEEIRLTINCQDYNLTGDAKDKDKGFNVIVDNHDVVPLNLCLQKTNSIKGSAESKAGSYRLYNNRTSSEPISQGNLYDIKVKVKNSHDNKDGIFETIFSGEISQNLGIIDKT